MIKLIFAIIIFTMEFIYSGNVLLKIKPNSNILNIADMVNAKDFKDLGSGIYLLEFDDDKNLTKMSIYLKSNDSILYAYPDKIRAIRKR